MSGSNYRGPTGLQRTLNTRDEVYRAWDALPEPCRRRLMDATLPIDPVAVLNYYAQQREHGRSDALAQRHIIETIERTEKTAADKLETERATWNLGKAMAEAVKVSLSRLRRMRAA